MSADPTVAASSLLGLAQGAITEATDVVPRLVDRSRRQFRFVVSVIDHVRCADRSGESSATDFAEPDLDATTHLGASAPTEIQVPRPQSGPDASRLAIPDYDSLAASQVLPRLVGLSADELTSIREYESVHRGRRTILGRIAQLQG